MGQYSIYIYTTRNTAVIHWTVNKNLADIASWLTLHLSEFYVQVSSQRCLSSYPEYFCSVKLWIVRTSLENTELQHLQNKIFHLYLFFFCQHLKVGLFIRKETCQTKIGKKRAIFKQKKSAAASSPWWHCSVPSLTLWMVTQHWSLLCLQDFFFICFFFACFYIQMCCTGVSAPYSILYHILILALAN